MASIGRFYNGDHNCPSSYVFAVGSDAYMVMGDTDSGGDELVHVFKNGVDLGGFWTCGASPSFGAAFTAERVGTHIVVAVTGGLARIGGPYTSTISLYSFDTATDSPVGGLGSVACYSAATGGSEVDALGIWVYEREVSYCIAAVSDTQFYLLYNGPWSVDGDYHWGRAYYAFGDLTTGVGSGSEVAGQGGSTCYHPAGAVTDGLGNTHFFLYQSRGRVSAFFTTEHVIEVMAGAGAGGAITEDIWWSETTQAISNAVAYHQDGKDYVAIAVVAGVYPPYTQIIRVWKKDLAGAGWSSADVASGDYPDISDIDFSWSMTHSITLGFNSGGLAAASRPNTNRGYELNYVPVPSTRAEGHLVVAWQQRENVHYSVETDGAWSGDSVLFTAPNLTEFDYSMSAFLEAGFAVPALAFSCGSLPDGMEDEPYSGQIIMVGGTPPYTFYFYTETFPPGLDIDPTGAITGTPTKAGQYRIDFRFHDSTWDSNPDHEIKKSCSITINFNCHCADPPSGAVSMPYEHQFEVTGGKAVWNVVDGSLPDGLNIDSATGVIQGTPTRSGTFTFTILVLGDQ